MPLRVFIRKLLFEFVGTMIKTQLGVKQNSAGFYCTNEELFRRERNE